MHSQKLIGFACAWQTADGRRQTACGAFNSIPVMAPLCSDTLVFTSKQTTPQGRRTVVKGTHVISRHTAWIEDIAEPEEAWRQLDKRYGSNNLAELSTMYTLESLKLPKGSTTRKATHIYAAANNADIQPSGSQVGCKQEQTHNKINKGE